VQISISLFGSVLAAIPRLPDYFNAASLQGRMPAARLKVAGTAALLLVAV